MGSKIDDFVPRHILLSIHFFELYFHSLNFAHGNKK